MIQYFQTSLAAEEQIIKMFTKYQTIKDFDNYPLDEHEQRCQSTMLFKNSDILKQTQDDCHEINQHRLKIRSLKSRSLSIQTSFHNKILDKHLQCFRKHFLLHQEKFFPGLKNSTFAHAINQFFGSHSKSCGNDEKLKDLLRKDSKYFETNEKKLFEVDLYYEQTLSEFLSQICTQLPYQIAIQLVYTASMFWKAYVENQGTQLTEEEIKVLVQKVLKSEQFQNFTQSSLLLQLPRFNQTPALKKEETEQNLKLFLKIFGFTILMIVQQYFSNPFSKGQEPKLKTKNIFEFRDISNDEFSDDEDEMELYFGSKKRKL